MPYRSKRDLTFFLKLWFCFVAALAGCIFVVVTYQVVEFYKMGPAGIAHELGRAAASFEAGRAGQ